MNDLMYTVKGLVARFLDLFDPDDYTYVVSNPEPETLAPHAQQHVLDQLS